MIQVASLGQIAAMQVVGDNAHHGGINVGTHNGGQLLSQRTGGRRLAQHGVAAHASAVHDFLGAQGLVAGGNASSHALVQGSALHVNQVTLGGHALHAGNVVQALHQVGIIGQNVGTNAFRNSHGIFALQGLANNLGVELACAGFQSGAKRNMRRNDEIQIQIGDFVFSQHGFNALNARNNAHFVQVGHDGGGAMLQNALGKGANCQVGTFGMNVAVNEAGSDVLAAGVNDLGALADAVFNVAHCRDGLIANSHATFVNFARVHVDNLAILNDHVCRFSTTSYRKKLLVHARPFLSFCRFFQWEEE